MVPWSPTSELPITFNASENVTFDATAAGVNTKLNGVSFGAEGQPSDLLASCAFLGLQQDRMCSSSVLDHGLFRRTV